MYGFIFFTWTLRREIAGSSNSCVFNFLRNLHTVFHNSRMDLYSHQQCTKFPFSPHPGTPFFFFNLFDNSHSNRNKKILHCGLICISLIISDVEHLFLCLLAICMFSLEKHLFRSPAYCLIKLFWGFIVELYEFFVHIA